MSCVFVVKNLIVACINSWEAWINPYEHLGKRSVVVGPKYFTDGPPDEDNPPRGLGLTSPLWLTRVRFLVVLLGHLQARELENLRGGGGWAQLVEILLGT
jgi:hypothetical protein